MALITRTFKLKWSKMITPQVKHLAFSPIEGELAPFIAGQFVTLHIQHGGKTQHRSYSLSNTSTCSDSFEIAAAYVKNGLASELLFNMQPDSLIEMSGPHGLFVLKDEQPKRYILVATGTGVSPYRSMLAQIEQRLATEDLEVQLILGVRNQAELLFAADFRALAARMKNFSFSACYSQELPLDPLLDEVLGRVLVALPALNLNPLNDIVYLCGNPSMIDDAFAMLTELGFDRKNVRREKYSFTH